MLNTGHENTNESFQNNIYKLFFFIHNINIYQRVAYNYMISKNIVCLKLQLEKKVSLI